MIKTKSILLLVLMLVLMESAYAANVAVITRFKDSTEKNWCVFVADGGTAKDALDATDLTLSWSGSGSMAFLNSVNGVVSDYSNNEAWSFWHQNSDGNAFEESMVGLGGYTVSSSGTVIGLSYSAYDPVTFQFLAPPTFTSYSTVCQNKLKVDNIKIYVDGDKESADENGGTINVIPDSKIKMEIKVENLYSASQNTEIRNIKIKGAIKDIDDGEDIEEEADEFDLDAADDDKVELEFNIPLAVEEDNYDLELTIEGKDEKNLEYKSTIMFKVDVEKKKHNVIFKRIELDNEEMSCSRTTELSLDAANIGNEDEEISLEIKNSDLGININEKGIALDADPSKDNNEYKKTYTIEVEDDQKEGTYPLSIKVKYSGEEKEEKINLRLSDCERAQTQTTTLQSSGAISQAAESSAAVQPEEKTEAAEQLKKDEELALKERNTALLIGLADVVVIIAGALLFLKFLRKK